MFRDEFLSFLDVSMWNLDHFIILLLISFLYFNEILLAVKTENAGTSTC